MTVAVGRNLLLLRPAGKDLERILPLSCKTSDGLFASLGRGKAMVLVAGYEAGDDAPKEKLGWSAEKAAYGFTWLLDQQPADLKMMPPGRSTGRPGRT